jgi:AcrR family transcriptional regulator
MPRVADPALAERRRGQILAAALTCFRRRGFHQATMQEICAEARVSPGALYRYFSSKADIIAAIAEEERAMIEPLFASMENGANVADGLAALAEGALQKFAAENDAPLIADVMAEAARDPLLARRFAEADRELRVRVAAIIRAGQERGEIDPTLDPGRVARLMPALIDGLGLRFGFLREGEMSEMIDDFRDFITRYLRTQSHPHPNPRRKASRPEAELTPQETTV